MESILWPLHSHDAASFARPLLFVTLLGFILFRADFVLILLNWCWAKARGVKDNFRPQPLGHRPSALVIIPSLLRNRDDFSAITLTVDSCATNLYPGELVIIASVDGVHNKPALYAELCAWAESRSYPDNVRVCIGGTERQSGKMMAVEAGVELMWGMVRRGQYREFPTLYFSIDGDGTLGSRALERLADRLTSPHPVTGKPRRAVAGKCCIRPELYWQGWTLKSLRSYFTVEGQIYRQVAREFVLANMCRYNLGLKPYINLPGGLYCTWSQLIIQAPKFMGYLRTIRFRDWAKWWLGFGAPRFSTSRAAPLPEALTGPSDDTCISFLAQFASWDDRGRLSLEPPRSPLHAMSRLLKAYFVERTPDYAPEARVFTYTPCTIKGLWVQRVRWNASTFECGYRFKNALIFHWQVGAFVLFHYYLLAPALIGGAIFYILLPREALGVNSLGLMFLLGYVAQAIMLVIYLGLALAIDSDRRRLWPALFASPLAPLYNLGINFFSSIYGVSKDLLFYGNTTKFAPEWTFIKGQTVRLALLFRVKRFFGLCLRAVVHGDVPFGRFWYGWTETPWTPSGYEGWTTGKRRKVFPLKRLPEGAGDAAPRSLRRGL
ncbi:MAG TPA: glycosyltransferase family 2 protein [Myxococcaceae bacterium]|nr:glycosyltransferase family 2 protein [Myxococcaceae bacterium]